MGGDGIGGRWEGLMPASRDHLTSMQNCFLCTQQLCMGHSLGNEGRELAAPGRLAVPSSLGSHGP